METNESVKPALMQAVETEVVKLLEQVQGLAEGDLKGLEQQVLASAFALGRALLEGLVNESASQPRPPTRREGSCGHEQQLVGQRAKQV